jgi:hypothetical protein
LDFVSGLATSYGRVGWPTSKPKKCGPGCDKTNRTYTALSVLRVLDGDEAEHNEQDPEKESDETTRKHKGNLEHREMIAS